MQDCAPSPADVMSFLSSCVIADVDDRASSVQQGSLPHHQYSNKGPPVLVLHKASGTLPCQRGRADMTTWKGPPWRATRQFREEMEMAAEDEYTLASNTPLLSRRLGSCCAGQITV